MQHRQHQNAIGLEPVEDGIGEFRNDGATHFAVNLRKHLRITLYSLEYRARRGKKIFAKALPLRFVVFERCRQIPTDLPAENNRQRHSAPTGVGENLI